MMNESTRQSVKNLLSKDGSNIEQIVKLYPEVRNDQELLSVASKTYLKSNGIVSDNNHMRNNKEFCSKVIKKDSQFIQLVSEELLKDDIFIKELIVDGACIYDYLSEERRSSKELTLMSLIYAGNGSAKIPLDIFIEGKGTNNIPSSLLDDKDIVRQWVINGGTINIASYRLVTDMEFVKEMVLIHKQNFNYAGDKLKHVPEFLKFVVQHYPEKIADVEMYELCYPELLNIYFSQKDVFSFKEIRTPSAIMLFKDKTHLDVLKKHFRRKTQDYFVDALEQMNDMTIKDSEIQFACWIVEQLNLNALLSVKDKLLIKHKKVMSFMEIAINVETDKRNLLNIKKSNRIKQKTSRKIQR